MTAVENIRESFRSLRANLLRSILTLLMITFGIACLIGVFTSIDGLKYWLMESMSPMGSNTFNIVTYGTTIRSGGPRSQRDIYPPITYRQATAFKDRFEDGEVSLTATGTGAGVFKYRNRTTNENIQVIGTDENYVKTANYKIERGRNLTAADVEMRKNVVVIGKEIEKKLFPGEDALGKTVYTGGNNYVVIGIFQEMGTVGRTGGDKIAVVPISKLRVDYDVSSYGVSVYVDNPERMEEVMIEAAGTFRLVRRLHPIEGSNFAMTRAEQIVASLMENLLVLTATAIFIAVTTLFAAAIGLLNMMLVSVTERTREIGVRKALGARKSNVLFQFLTESLVICLTGGIAGIVVGALLGNIIGALLGNTFVFPWKWTFISIIVCTVVGLLSGLYPAWKAAKVDPIESLRYE